MELYTVRYFIDACFKAKSITGMMGTLPPKIKPRHIRIISVIKELSEIKNCVTVGNVSEFLQITSPSVIKSINELCDLKVVIKESIPEDKRVTKLSLTETGEYYYDLYILKHHKYLHSLFSEFSEEEMQTTIKVINKSYLIMKNSRKKKNNFDFTREEIEKKLNNEFSNK